MARITNIALPNGTSYDIYPSEVDATPTNGSDKMVTSDGVYDAVAGVASDLSSLNTTVLGEQSTSINSRLTVLEATDVRAVYDSTNQCMNLTQVGDEDIADYQQLATDVAALQTDKLDIAGLSAGDGIVITPTQDGLEVSVQAMTTAEINAACPELEDY